MSEQRHEIVPGPLDERGWPTFRANFWATTGAASTQTCRTRGEAEGWVNIMKQRDGRSR